MGQSKSWEHQEVAQWAKAIAELALADQGNGVIIYSEGFGSLNGALTLFACRASFRCKYCA